MKHSVQNVCSRLLGLAATKSAEIGLLFWLFGVLAIGPSPFDKAWALAILAFAPLVLVPLALKIVDRGIDPKLPSRSWQVVMLVQLPTAIVFAFGLTQPVGFYATLLVLPWLVTCLLIASVGFGILRASGIQSAEDIGISAGMMMLPVGAGWAVLDRYGIRPLDFESVIVLLTAIHFHYAGLALPILAGLAAQRSALAKGRWLVVAVILSVPAVAVGITATRLQLSPIIESIAGWLMSGVGLLVAWKYWRMAHQEQWPKVSRMCWRVASASLTFGMILSLMYASRHVARMDWLDIPWMRALHGTANAFGFSLIALVGWLIATRCSGKGVQTPGSHLAS